MTEETTEPGGRAQLKCDWCGWPFTPPKATGRMPRYCRRSCRQRAYEARQTQEAVAAAVLRRTKGQPPVRSAVPAGAELEGAESLPLF
ncbi:hypothetical protein [Streptomyces sp. NRRL B-24484]|uniref:hypothetical protein n=1 Tax=Streptomyces sp. NRRL B-24484 TaxID=1463833 RepID=UPI0005BBCFB2|nr:hypothetical protein [Streptomyces sp. NRRL B-24484]